MATIKKLLVVTVSLLFIAGYDVIAADPRPFLHPDRIRYDSQCLTIDGKDMFIYSGAFHYFRCPKELWHDRFQKIKEAGFNCVETYVAWNACEPTMPSSLNDFSQVHLDDLDDFLSMAEQFGFYVIVRPGPYICAEWDGGGYPQWLLTKRPADKKENWLRSDDPTYLAWCKHWYDAVCPVIAKHQITRKSPGQPGVILMQLENEYDFAQFPDDVKLHQVKALGEAARADGIDVPFITCWTHQVRGQTDPLFRQIFDCCNFYPRWNVDSVQKDIDRLRREQTDAPLATTELQGGWFSKVGDKLSEDQEGITDTQINNLTLFTIQNGETMLNYYMLFGGTNPRDWAARDLTTTYDYNAPIREWGGIGPRYQRVWALGHMLQQHPDLARTKAVNCSVTAVQSDVTMVMRESTNGGRYLFIRTSQHTEPRQGTAHVKPEGSEQELVFDYQLEPFGSKILYLPAGVNDPAQGEWLPKAAPAIERPTDLPQAVAITSALSRADAGPTKWSALKPGEDLARAGIYDSEFIYYQAKISTPVATNVVVEYPDGDAVLATVNGHIVPPINGTREHTMFPLSAGDNDIRLLCENHGHANGGSAMEELCGIRSLRFAPTAAGAARSLDHWRMKLVDDLKNRKEIRTDFDDSNWSEVSASGDANQLTPDEAAVFRTSFDLSAADLKGFSQVFNIVSIDDLGSIYVNGKLVRRTRDWSEAYSMDITKYLHAGHNVIAIAVQNQAAEGGISKPTLVTEMDGAAVPVKSFGRAQGNEEQWWNAEPTDAAWMPVPIGTSATTSQNNTNQTWELKIDAQASNSPNDTASNWTLKVGAQAATLQNDPLLTWDRMNFTLPARRTDIWVPWRVHLVCTGNGFLYLNGHALGRYWEAGPQHDFFLPECWLKFGDGQTNNLTLSLRPVKGAAVVQEATVEPYFNFAEKR